jgi:uncharacterized membrane protein YphA (DoxX/SURF4 family)
LVSLILEALIAALPKSLWWVVSFLTILAGAALLVGYLANQAVAS